MNQPNETPLSARQMLMRITEAALLALFFMALHLWVLPLVNWDRMSPEAGAGLVWGAMTLTLFAIVQCICTGADVKSRFYQRWGGQETSSRNYDIVFLIGLGVTAGLGALVVCLWLRFGLRVELAGGQFAAGLLLGFPASIAIDRLVRQLWLRLDEA